MHSGFLWGQPEKLLFLIMTALIVVGCSKSDEEKSDIQEIWLNGYKALTPESDYENGKLRLRWK